MDFVPSVVERARALVPEGDFRCMDVRSLDLPDGSYDLVLDFSTGDHLDAAGFRAMLAEVHRILRPGGEFVCVFLNRAAMARHAPQLWGPDTREEHGRFGYSRGETPAEMRDLLAAAGFEVVGQANTDQPRSGYLARRCP